MAGEDEEDGEEVVLASATVGADGTLPPISVQLERTEESDEEEAVAHDSNGNVIGKVIEGVLGAASTAVSTAGKVAGKVFDAVTPNGESSDKADE